MPTKKSLLLPLIILIIVAAVFIFIVFRLTSNQSAPDSGAATDVKTILTLSSPPSVVGISSGSNLVVSLSLQNSTGINVSEIVLTYDPDVLEATTISEKTDILALNKTMDNTNGRLTVDIALSGAGDFPEDTDLVDFTFRVKNASVNNTVIETDDDSTFGIPNQIQPSNLGSLSLTFIPTSCGDGVVQTPNDDGENEQCDEGSNNGIACTPNAGSSCQYCALDCTFETVVSDPNTPPTTVTCYRCTTGLTDGNACESFTATDFCPSNSSSVANACATAVGGSCPVSTGGNVNPPPQNPPSSNSNNGGTGSNGGVTTLPDTAIVNNSTDILLGFLFILLGITTYKYLKR